MGPAPLPKQGTNAEIGLINFLEIAYSQISPTACFKFQEMIYGRLHINKAVHTDLKYYFEVSGSNFFRLRRTQHFENYTDFYLMINSKRSLKSRY
jgi:hypothetical protein